MLIAVEPRRQTVGTVESNQGVRVAGPPLAVDRRDELLEPGVAPGALGEDHTEEGADALVDRRAQRGIGPDERLPVGSL